MNGNGFTSYLMITSGITPPDQSTRRPMTDEEIKITVSHEFNHALQMGYNYTKPIINNAWFYENTSTWMEEIQHPEINEWITTFLNQNTVNPLTHPSLNIDNDSFFYSGALFCHLLSRWFNNNLLKNIWVYSATSDNTFLSDINTVLVNNGQNLKNALKRYAVWRYFTGLRDDGVHFPKGHTYPTSKDLYIYNNGIGSGNSSSDNLSSRGGTSYITFKNAQSPINISFDGQNNIEFSVIAFNKRIYFDNIENYFSLNSLNEGTINNLSCIGEDYVILIPVITDWQNLQSNILYSYNSVLGTGISTSFWNEKENLNLGGSLNLQGSNTISSGQSRNLSLQLNYRSVENSERFNNILGKTVKHNNWNDISSKFFLINDFEASNINNRQSAKFNFIEPSRIESRIDGLIIPNAGYFQFQDPWYVKSDGTQPGDYWIPCTSTYEPTGKDGATEKGVFLNQVPDPNNPNKPFYSVQVDAVQDVPLTNTGVPSGRNHKFYFQNWTATPQGSANFQGANYPSTPVVFTQDGATVQANLKGTQLSNSTTAFNSNSQRKYVKTDDGWLHLVYESMGSVWYETSSDNGTTWVIQNNGKPISANGKLPAIDYCFFPSPNQYNRAYHTVITWQEYYNSSSFKIKVAYFDRRLFIDPNLFPPIDPNSMYWFGTQDVATINGDYNTANCYPVICLNYGGFNIVYKNGASGGLYHRSANRNINTGIYTPLSTVTLLTGTDANSVNPSLAVNKTGELTVNLVWEQKQSVSSSSIKYAVIVGSQISGSISTISSGSGFNLNFSPSISTTNGLPIVSWTAGVYSPAGITDKKAITVKGTTWSTYQRSGSEVNYVYNNSVNSASEKTVIVWSEGTTNSVSKWMKRVNTVYYAPKTLSSNGLNLQVCNGNDLQNMSAMIYKSTSTPYYFLKSTNDFSALDEETGGGLEKITLNDTIVTFGRGGVASINDIEFVFNTGDLMVDDSVISFIEMPDTLVYSSSSALNQWTRTNNFALTPNSAFYFSNIYYVVQKSDPDSSLSTTDNVNFKVELVNAITEQVVGTFDNITYNKNNLQKYASIDYEVDCSGITAGQYYLRLVTNVNGNANYALANIFNDNTTLAKKSYQKVNFKGVEIPDSYSLDQNYPNPFNPNTTIRYQLPQNGMVTLKVYDILGAEVATLVNEEKLAGKYQVTFDASTLASGVYIYKLQAGSFTNSKKMLLLK